MSTPVTYHYCSLDTAAAILSTGTLRLSDVTKSNDSAEIAYGYGAALEALERCGLLSRRDGTVRFDDDWTNLLRPRYRDMLRDALADRTMPPNRICYAICLSGHHDLLSQWRAYGDDGQGVALGFDLTPIADMPPLFDAPGDTGEGPWEQRAMMLYQPVAYGREPACRAFDGMARHILSCIHSLREAPQGEHADARRELLDATLMLVASTAFCKKRFFREEREWRLAFWGPKAHVGIGPERMAATILDHGSPWLTSARFQVLARGNRLVPVVDLGLDFRRTLRDIVLGPRCRAGIQDMELMLASLGLDGVQVRPSNGTYRH